MEPHRISESEKARLTDQAAHLFIARHVRDYFPCEINSRKMMNFIESQLGENYPYPFTLDHFEAAFDYLNTHDFLLQRPIEEPEVDPAVARENAAQQKVRDDHAARVEADKIARDRAMPLTELGAKVSQQNAQFREQRDQNLLPTRTPGLESRSLSTVTFGDKATARNNVAMANPTLNRNGAAFMKLYAEELQKLRQQ
jgi:hypothetical protein